MGCASSNPLVEGGKNLADTAKETTGNVIAKGEKVMHDAGEAVSTGVDHVKHAVETGISTAQNSIGSVVHSVENTIGITRDNAENKMHEAETKMEDAANKTSEITEDAISDAKTVLAFETENMIEKEHSLRDEFGEKINEVGNNVMETLHIEDIEQSNEHEAPPKDEAKPESEEKKAEEEEEQLTPWEAAADEILERSLKSSIDLEEAIELDFGLEPENKSDRSVTEVAKSEIFDKEYNDILLSDTLSIKSYKSEI